jgi:GGDEF domain-containing protein
MPRWMGIVLLLAAPWLGDAMAAPVTLPPGEASIALEHQPQVLVPRGTFTVADAAAGRLDRSFSDADRGVPALSDTNELWVSLQLRNPSGQSAGWQVQVPHSSMDEVTLFDRHGAGWIEQSAGDRVAQPAWPRPGRFASFPLRLEAGETRRVFLRVRNAMAAPVPLWLVSDAAAIAQDQRASTAIGLVLGALALLAAACLVQAAIYRDTSYFLYGLYTLALGLSYASISGLAGQYFWGDHPEWGNVAKAAFPMVSAGFSVWLVRALCRLHARAKVMAWVTGAVGAVVICIAIAFGALSLVMPGLMAVAMFSAVGTVLYIALWTWHRGDRMGAWVLAAHMPVIGVTVMVILRMFGFAPFGFDSSVGTSIAIGAILPLMLVALHRRSREVLAVQVRAREMRAIDPLTGLLSPRLFGDRVRAATRRYAGSRHNCAVLYIRVANYQRIRETHGSAQAEQSMTRAAVTLQRLMPDADSIGRVGESTMGLIFETITERGALLERVSRLVAYGLMPIKGLKPEISLNLLVVGNVLADNPMEAVPLQAALDAALDSLSPRTRRPIRFLERNAAGLARVDPDVDSEQEDQATVQPA